MSVVANSSTGSRPAACPQLVINHNGKFEQTCVPWMPRADLIPFRARCYLQRNLVRQARLTQVTYADILSLILLTYRRQTVMPPEQTRGPDVAKSFLSKSRPDSGTSDAGTYDLDAAIPSSAAEPAGQKCAYCVVLLVADCDHDSSRAHRQARASRERDSGQRKTLRFCPTMTST